MCHEIHKPPCSFINKNKHKKFHKQESHRKICEQLKASNISRLYQKISVRAGEAENVIRLFLIYSMTAANIIIQFDNTVLGRRAELREEV